MKKILYSSLIIICITIFVEGVSAQVFIPPINEIRTRTVDSVERVENRNQIIENQQNNISARQNISPALIRERNENIENRQGITDMRTEARINSVKIIAKNLSMRLLNVISSMEQLASRFDERLDFFKEMGVNVDQPKEKIADAKIQISISKDLAENIESKILDVILNEKNDREEIAIILREVSESINASRSLLNEALRLFNASVKELRDLENIKSE
ncbi:MAG TPA: hypothetical protein PKA60_01345 [Candidatus Paceibacterota bacterium]|nr:hypothetical protein [Candidatus Paceibacterota bacterium]